MTTTNPSKTMLENLEEIIENYDLDIDHLEVLRVVLDENLIDDKLFCMHDLKRFAFTDIYKPTNYDDAVKWVNLMKSEYENYTKYIKELSDYGLLVRIEGFDLNHQETYYFVVDERLFNNKFMEALENKMNFMYCGE
ncbi:hypothetical protein GJU41_00165 [Bacillus idriensis]|uniref:Uncharacterized protein n=1 Tax=Metabacillus idriensis TaxID=324768 RepID=A0A6I2M300_9BACI|nr:hypothetical protein [Metabacillus idriensis]MRX52369.1 hypothetical protein [Metabacillus idriensis]